MQLSLMPMLPLMLMMNGARFGERSRKQRRVLGCVLLGVSLAIVFTVPAGAQRRPKNAPAPAPGAVPSGPNLQPKLVPGEVLRYQVEFQTITDTARGGAVQDPEGPTHIVVVWDATIRLEVLGGAGGSGAPAGAGAAGTSTQPPADGQNVSGAGTAGAAGATGANVVRLRTTYEQSTAKVQSDTPDPQSDAIVKQYTQMEGRTVEFTLGADGRVTAVEGLAGILSDQDAINAAEQWMSQISVGGSSPAGRVIPGLSWSSEQPADSLPLAGLDWRTDSTYLRDEPCHPAAAPSVGASSSASSSSASSSGSIPSSGAKQREEICAVILMNLSLVPARVKHDATPDEFRRKGLATTGHWTGSGDSLSYVSLQNGWVVSASQSGTQEMDVNIANSMGTSVHYAGKVETHSLISLLPPSPPANKTPAR